MTNNMNNTEYWTSEVKIYTIFTNGLSVRIVVLLDNFRSATLINEIKTTEDVNTNKWKLVGIPNSVP